MATKVSLTENEMDYLTNSLISELSDYVGDYQKDDLIGLSLEERRKLRKKLLRWRENYL